MADSSDNRRTHYFPANGVHITTNRLSINDFVACQQDDYGNVIYGYGSTELEAIADLVERIRKEPSDA